MLTGGNHLLIELPPGLVHTVYIADYSVSFVSILIVKYSDYKNKEKQENLHMLICLECALLSKSYLPSTVIYTMV